MPTHFLVIGYEYHHYISADLKGKFHIVYVTLLHSETGLGLGLGLGPGNGLAVLFFSLVL